jgi:carboxyl-terminal processing protease
MALNDAVKRMRGKPNTAITLTVVRKGETKPLTFTLNRAVIKIQSVKAKLVEPGFGFFRVTQFQEHTAENLAKAIEKVIKENNGPLRGIVLDLRNDPGGLLNGAVAVSAMFLPQNALVVYTDGRTEDSKMRLTASPENYLRGSLRDDFVKKLPPEVKTVPMVVLVNGGSASASEIVAGALQDHKRAIVLGTQTFGKGSVQTILPLGNNTAIKLTTARYYTPSGRSIQAKGITPDILAEDPASAETSLRLREADLERHLSNDKEKESEVKPEPSQAKPEIKPESKPDSKPKKDEEKDKSDQGPPKEFGSKDDYQLNQALNLLKGLQVLQKQQGT